MDQDKRETFANKLINTLEGLTVSEAQDTLTFTWAHLIETQRVTATAPIPDGSPQKKVSTIAEEKLKKTTKLAQSYYRARRSKV